MPSFVHESLLWWGLPLVGVPILIHLINLMRHRRVAVGGHGVSAGKPEAASHLDPVQAAAAAAAADGGRGGRGVDGGPAAGAQPVGRAVRRHQDASCRAVGRQLFDVRPLGRHQRLRRRPSRSSAGWPRRPRIRTRRRSSRCCGSRAPGDWPRGTQPDLLRRAARRRFSGDAGKGARAAARPRETAAEPADALEAVDRLPPQGRRTKTAWSTSSPTFAPNEWQEPAALRKALAAARRVGAQLHLVNCVDAMHANLAIAALRPGPGTRAAGVPLLVEVVGAQFRRRPAPGRSRCRWKKTAMRGRRS